MTVRRVVVRKLAALGIAAVRHVYVSCPVDVLRVAALVEISAAAASLARTIVKLNHLDPASIAPYVSDPGDMRAVLGRGRWLPTMIRHVPEANTKPGQYSRRPAPEPAQHADQIALFPDTGTGAASCR
ncbi:hypothetical protein [Catenuloplanes atrovinosus]|uniref:Uncharacterized protein n=1 Tax=Catenuloplanes atrovinosus TaxID=137266 RepID=A0AAE4CEJ0_9ACTN|nr:hypothetical protein [Catenuloplanes atrovinosus]MDR7278685.1 hypothetical protein [Catenuloplanes atrovinosus]